MVRKLIALVLFALPLSASAGEVEVRYQAVPEGASGGLTYLDIAAGPIPSLEVRGPEGERYRVGLSIEPQSDEIITVHAHVQAIKAKGKTEKLKDHARLAATVSDGQPAMLRFAAEGDEAGVEIEVTPRLSKVTLMKQAEQNLKQDAPPAEPEPAPTEPEEATPEEPAEDEAGE